jgi:hypothetical protein
MSFNQSPYYGNERPVPSAKREHSLRCQSAVDTIRWSMEQPELQNVDGTPASINKCRNRTKGASND